MKDKYLQQVQSLICDHENEIYRAHSQFTNQELVAIYTTALHQKNAFISIVISLVLRRRLQEAEPQLDTEFQTLYLQAVNAFHYVTEYPYRGVLGLKVHSRLIDYAPAIKAYIDKWLDSPTALPYANPPEQL